MKKHISQKPKCDIDSDSDSSDLYNLIVTHYSAMFRTKKSDNNAAILPSKPQ